MSMQWFLVSAQNAKPDVKNTAKPLVSQIKSWVDTDNEALDGLRVGVKQVGRLCKTNLAPLKNNDANPSLPIIIFKEQDRYSAISSLAESNLVQLQQALSKATKEQKENCLEGLNFFSNFLGGPQAKVCIAINQRVKRINELTTLAMQWKQIHEERHQLFASLFSYENSGCTRPGFTEKIFLEHEKTFAYTQDPVFKLFEKELALTLSETFIPVTGNKP
jgi:hypothetical protein